jgi:hypothetical protein
MRHVWCPSQDLIPLLVARLPIGTRELISLPERTPWPFDLYALFLNCLILFLKVSITSQSHSIARSNSPSLSDLYQSLFIINSPRLFYSCMIKLLHSHNHTTHSHALPTSLFRALFHCLLLNSGIQLHCLSVITFNHGHGLGPFQLFQSTILGHGRQDYDVCLFRCSVQYFTSFM